MAQMTGRPFNLYPHEVRAIQAGRQTQLRRIAKLGPYADECATELANGRIVPTVKCCPFGAPGERLWCRERMWISECGGYYAYDARAGSNEVLRDVVSADGSRLWLAPRYQPTGFDDPDPRFQYPEFPHMVSSWSNQGRRLRGGRWVEAFDQGFCDVDTSIRIRGRDSLTASQKAVKARYAAAFRKRKSATSMPRRFSRLTLEVVRVRCERVREISGEDALAEGIARLSKDDGRTCKHGIPEADGLPGPSGWQWRDWQETPGLAFRALWNRLHGQGAWERNDWVWVRDFRVVSPCAPAGDPDDWDALRGEG